MNATTEQGDDDVTIGRLTMPDGTVVLAWRAARDGRLVVQIDTVVGTDDHTTARVYVNDAEINGVNL